MPTRNSAHNRGRNSKSSSEILSIMDANPSVPTKGSDQNGRGFVFKRSHSLAFGGVIVILLLGMGIMAKNGWFPTTDAVSGKRTGWFGKPLPKNSSSSWSLLPDPTPTPVHLSKENIYAGSRLLSVVDANAQEAPPADLAVWRASNGVWYVFGGNPGSNQTFFQLGMSGDQAAPGDYS